MTALHHAERTPPSTDPLLPLPDQPERWNAGTDLSFDEAAQMVLDSPSSSASPDELQYSCKFAFTWPLVPFLGRLGILRVMELLYRSTLPSARSGLCLLGLIVALVGGCGENTGPRPPVGPDPLDDGGPPPQWDAGDSNIPYPLPLNVTLTPTVGPEGPFYVADVIPGQTYYVFLRDSGRTITVSGFADDERTAVLDVCEIFDWGACEFTATGSSLYIELHTSFGGYESLELTLVPSGAVGEALTPVNDSSRPHTYVAMQNGESSYYVFDLLEAGSLLAGALHFDVDNGTNGDPRVSFYAGGDFSAPPVAGPSSIYTVSWRQVVSNLGTGPVGIRIEASGTGPTVHSLSFAPGLSEGAESERVPLAVGTSHDGSVDGGGFSYYSFVAPDDGGVELIFTGLENLNGNTAVSGGFYATDGTPITGGSCWVYTDTARCTADGLTSGETVHLRLSAMLSGQTFTLDIAQSSSEGNTTSPVVLTPEVTHTGGVSYEGFSYYSFTVPSTGGYELVLTPLDGGAPPNILVEPSFGTGDPIYPICDDVGCYMNGLTGGDTLAVTVSSESISGATESYELTLRAVPGNVGSPSDPVQLTVHSPDQVSVGAAPPSGGARSYYTFTTNDRNAGYLFIYWGTGDPSFSYSTVSFDSTSWSLNGASPDPQSRIMRDLPPNTTYSMTLREYNGSPALSGTGLLYELHSAAGCSAGATHCWDFEDGIYPAEFAIPAVGTSGFDIDAAAAKNGAYGISANTTGGSGNACLEITVAEESSLFAYTTSDSRLDVFVDDVEVTPFSDFRSGNGARLVVLTNKAAGHRYALCQSYSSGGTSGFEVDDIEVR